MSVTTASAAVHITPVVIKTFFEHSKRKAKRLKDGSHEKEVPQDDIFFDEAFHIVKAFIEMGTKNTIESLQAFTNTHVPTPYWAAVSPVCIPLSSCNRAADVLIDWFGPEELKHVVGGERWWQVRGLDGIDAEWVTQKEYLDSQPPLVGRNLSDEDMNIVRMEKLDRVMLYIHGGGYFWGSINTHRYQIIRYARKFKGRAFAVNYRKAPQYPWPCPLQDVIAAYLYLIQPPPESLHKPIAASKIVFAGDSAGGGLCATVLTILRDLGLPMPSGAVLISPWVDMTHSFPSVMQNTATDIIPQHGFLAKPSTVWPMDLLPPEGGRVVPTKTNPPPDPGHGDTLKPCQSRIEEGETGDTLTSEKVKTQGEMLDKDTPIVSSDDLPEGQVRSNSDPVSNGSSVTMNVDSEASAKGSGDDCDDNGWEPKPPKVLMEDPNAVPLELRSQIHQYATTEQLSHPLVSPVLQGSLGNLPPLYILAGDGEVLRDEVIYLAHRAAQPSKYPARSGVVREGRRQKENAKKFTEPTRVHLQVFDGMCHVLTVFSFTKSAKYAYRSIAEFVKHVSQHDEKHLARNPFPELHRPLSEISTDSDLEDFPKHSRRKKSRKEGNASAHDKEKRKSSSNSDINLYRHNEAVATQEVKGNDAESMHNPTGVHLDTSVVEQGQQDIPGAMLIRERVDISGKARPMEPEEEIQALQLKPEQIGMIKEAPTLRWLKGQEIWDKRYKHQAERAIKKRRKLTANAEEMLQTALEQGLVHEPQGRSKAQRRSSAASTHSRKSSSGKIQEDRRWGPLDLEEENPPPSAIAKRRDTPEALALLKKSIYHTAPVTHLTVPRIKAIDAIRAAFDPKDDPTKPPQQSASEQQVRAHLIPVHGLRMWDGLIRYIGRRTATKASDGSKQAAEAIKIATGLGSPKPNAEKAQSDCLPAMTMPTGD